MRLAPLSVLAALVVAGACTPRPTATPPAPPRTPTVIPPTRVTLAALTPGVSVQGFTPTAVYLDGAGQPIGARLIHDRTRFTLDYLRIESAPQGFVWVNSFPTSDKGEPHTQEHLLLGKGDRGRRMASAQAMALVESSAFTAQWRTAYHFHTVASRDTFWPVLEETLGAMLDADYTDEEIRREVRNFGTDRDARGALTLEEKGTVYNEMVRTYEAPDVVLWRAALRQVYGDHHPLAYEAGGYPDAIRTMTPADIRRFHADNYHLANMGVIAAFPAAMALGEVLDRASEVLDRANPRTGEVTTEATLPAPAPAATIAPVTTVDYPAGDATSPSPVMLVWPASRALDLTEHTLLELFLSAVAGDDSTPLYKRLIDSQTRALDLGASALGVSASNDQGQPVFLTVEGVRADRLDPTTLTQLRAEVAAALARIAALPAGDPELVALRARIASRLIDRRRQIAKLLDTPPGFGIRGTGSEWNDHLHALSRGGAFRRSLTLQPELAAIEAVLAGGGNPWTDRLARWGLLAPPSVIAARPSPALRAQLDADRARRSADELARLGALYGTRDPAATLQRYQADYEAQTAVLEAAAARAPLPALVASPPLTYDDDLRYATTPIAGVPAFTATIDSMQSARVSLAFRVDAVPTADLPYLALLPALMSEVGVVEGATPITSEAMRERLRQDILELSVGYDADPRTGRVELVVAGQGNDAAETTRALGWMRRVLLAPDWRLANLPRLRDVVDQALTGLRQTTQGAEEQWVHDPRDAWWHQGSPALLHTGSFMTRAHDLHRLRWQLLDPQAPAVTAEVTAYLRTLAGAARLPRAALVQLAAALADPRSRPAGAGARWLVAAARLSPPARALVAQAGADLTALLPELPDDALAADWTYLASQMARDLAVGAPAALARLTAVRQAIVAAATARVVAVGARATHAAIAGDLGALVGALDRSPRVVVTRPAGHPIADRVQARTHASDAPRFVGLVAPGTSSGVFVNAAPGTALTDVTDDAVLDYLASNQYTGHGAHSMFMKTWAAGLAYSNGLRIHVRDGFLEYYAERCPLLPQTLAFVAGQLSRAAADPNIARYALAGAFASRIATRYEDRAWAMATDLVDGVTPEVVRAFRTKVRALGQRADLAAELFRRMPAVYGKVLPGYGQPSPDAIQFVIGPAKQLDAYHAYLRTTLGPAAALARLYPRDFWLPADAAGSGAP